MNGRARPCRTADVSGPIAMLSGCAAATVPGPSVRYASCGMSVLVTATPESIAAAAAKLLAGDLVAFPTETVYGLGAAARNERAVEAVYRAKGRPASHPVIVHLPSLEAASQWADPLPASAVLLAGALWPGPLTVVVRRAAWVPDVITGGQATVALRVPSHPVALALLAAVPEGIAAPSANRFGRVSPTLARHVLREFPEHDLLVLDGGPCSVGLESTILDLSTDQPRLLRPGGVPLDAIEGLLGREVVVPTNPKLAGDLPRTPGTLPSHYAPDAAARLIEPLALRGCQEGLDAGTAVLSRRPRPAGTRSRWLRMPETADGYARSLYAALRSADASGTESILIEAVPEGPAWGAIRDRLARATAGSERTGGPRP